MLGGLLLTARADDLYKIDSVLAATSSKQMVAQFIVVLVVGFFVSRRSGKVTTV